MRNVNFLFFLGLVSAQLNFGAFATCSSDSVKVTPKSKPPKLEIDAAAAPTAEPTPVTPLSTLMAPNGVQGQLSHYNHIMSFSPDSVQRYIRENKEHVVLLKGVVPSKGSLFAAHDKLGNLVAGIYLGLEANSARTTIRLRRLGENGTFEKLPSEMVLTDAVLHCKGFPECECGPFLYQMSMHAAKSEGWVHYVDPLSPDETVLAVVFGYFSKKEFVRNTCPLSLNIADEDKIESAVQSPKALIQIFHDNEGHQLRYDQVKYKVVDITSLTDAAPPLALDDVPDNFWDPLRAPSAAVRRRAPGHMSRPSDELTFAPGTPAGGSSTRSRSGRGRPLPGSAKGKARSTLTPGIPDRPATPASLKSDGSSEASAMRRNFDGPH